MQHEYFAEGGGTRRTLHPFEETKSGLEQATDIEPEHGYPMRGVKRVAACVLGVVSELETPANVHICGHCDRTSCGETKQESLCAERWTPRSRVQSKCLQRTKRNSQSGGTKEQNPQSSRRSSNTGGAFVHATIAHERLVWTQQDSQNESHTTQVHGTLRPCRTFCAQGTPLTPTAGTIAIRYNLHPRHQQRRERAPGR